FALAAVAFVLGAAYALVSGGRSLRFAGLALACAVAAVLLFQLAQRGWRRKRPAGTPAFEPSATAAAPARVGAATSGRTPKGTLEVHPDAGYTEGIAAAEVAAVVAAMPGISRTGPSAFELSRRDAGYHLTIELACLSDAPSTEPSSPPERQRREA